MNRKEYPVGECPKGLSKENEYYQVERYQKDDIAPFCRAYGMGVHCELEYEGNEKSQ